MRIKCAAIIHNDVVHEGRSHAEIGWEMVDTGACSKPFPSGFYQGFVTDGGNYVDRRLAMIIAIKAGQVEKGKTIGGQGTLYSEDLIYSKTFDYPLKEKRYIRKNNP